MFCSDDKEARKGILALENIEEIKCISLLASFELLKNEINFSKNEANPYIDSCLSLYFHQPYFKVYEAKRRSLCKIEAQKIFNDIFKNRFDITDDGFLKYKEYTVS